MNQFANRDAIWLKKNEVIYWVDISNWRVSWNDIFHSSVFELKIWNFLHIWLAATEFFYIRIFLFFRRIYIIGKSIIVTSLHSLTIFLVRIAHLFLRHQGFYFYAHCGIRASIYNSIFFPKPKKKFRFLKEPYSWWVEESDVAVSTSTVCRDVRRGFLTLDHSNIMKFHTQFTALVINFMLIQI